MNNKLNFKWKPQEDFIVRFDDKTGEDRNQYDFDEFVKKLRSVANEFGFDIWQYGGNKSMAVSIILEWANNLKYENLDEE